MYYAGTFLGLRPLPQLLNEPLLSIMPGIVFGFLIDTLQHAGKVVEEFGLIVLMVAVLGGLGAASSVAGLRWTSRYLPFAFAGIGWLLVVAVLLPLGGLGFLGVNDGFPTPLIWASLFAIYAVVLQFGEQPAPGFDAGRRRILSGVPIAIGAVSLGRRPSQASEGSPPRSRRSRTSTWSPRTSAATRWSTARHGGFGLEAWWTGR